VRWYLRFGLSYRDVEEVLAERGIAVDHVTIYRGVQRFTPLLADAAGACPHAVGNRWFVDETYVKVAGKRLPRHRAIREQPRRMRPRSTRSPAPAAAWTQTRPCSTTDHSRSRAGAEHPPRPLRTRHRRAPPPAHRDCVRRTFGHHLNPKPAPRLSPTRPDPSQRNCAVREAPRASRGAAETGNRPHRSRQDLPTHCRPA